MSISNLFKVLLFFLRVGVIEAHDELAFKCELVVLVEQSSLGMADVKVTGKKRENRLLFNQILKPNSHEK